MVVSHEVALVRAAVGGRQARAQVVGDVDRAAPISDALPVEDGDRNGSSTRVEEQVVGPQIAVAQALRSAAPGRLASARFPCRSDLGAGVARLLPEGTARRILGGELAHYGRRPRFQRIVGQPEAVGVGELPSAAGHALHGTSHGPRRR